MRVNEYKACGQAFYMQLLGFGLTTNGISLCREEGREKRNRKTDDAEIKDLCLKSRHHITNTDIEYHKSNNRDFIGTR